MATDIDPAKLDGLEGCERRALDVTDAAAIAGLAAAHGRHRRAVQLCRLRPPRHHPGLHRGRLGFLVRPQRARHVPADQAFLPAMLERGGGSIVNMARVASSVKGVPEPLRLRRQQGRGDRPDQGGRRRLRHARHSLQRDLPRHGRDALARRAHRGRRAIARRHGRPSSPASRWAASARPRRSRASCSTWPRTIQATPPAASASSTAA